MVVRTTAGSLRPVADLRPSRALRYRDAAGPLGDLIAPPYDVITDADREALLARSPHNAVRLELPDEPYEAVAELMAAWERDGVLTRDDRPGITAWTQTFTLDGVTRERRTLLGTVGLEPYEARVVRPHERTHAGPKEGRLRLMYEANPMSFIVEQAGGMATDGMNRILEVQPRKLHQRVGVVLGSKNEVQRVADYFAKG